MSDEGYEVRYVVQKRDQVGKLRGLAIRTLCAKGWSLGSIRTFDTEQEALDAARAEDRRP